MKERSAFSTEVKITRDTRIEILYIKVFGKGVRGKDLFSKRFSPGYLIFS